MLMISIAAGWKPIVDQNVQFVITTSCWHAESSALIGVFLWLRHDINQLNARMDNLDSKFDKLNDNYAALRESMGWIRGRMGFTEGAPPSAE